MSTKTIERHFAERSHFDEVASLTPLERLKARTERRLPGKFTDRMKACALGHEIRAELHAEDEHDDGLDHGVLRTLYVHSF